MSNDNFKMDNLTAIIDKKRYDFAVEQLKQQINNKDVSNIAILGSYGSGKSSLLKTFKYSLKEDLIKKHKKAKPVIISDEVDVKIENSRQLVKEIDAKIIDISLATFNQNDEKVENTDSKSQDLDKRKKMANLFSDNYNLAYMKYKEQQEKVQENQIERSILQQLFYKVDRTKTPKSRLERVNKKLTFFEMATLFICAISLILLAMNITYNVWKPVYDPNIAKWLLIGFYVSLICIPLLGFNIFNRFKISKLKYKDFEAELNDTAGESLVNKFLDEIIYFFQSTKYEIVIFEDLDRFENIAIFSKLRELNRLINNNTAIRKTRSVKFIYAIKEGMFKNERERTKFFDYIIPVIPVVSVSNSRGELIRQFEKFDVHLDSKFLTKISLFVNDMRLLRNAVNEFINYKKLLDSNDIEGEKLFAIIIYKNLYPNEFEELQKDEGEIPGIFKKQKNILLKKIKENKESIKKLTKEIDDSKKYEGQNIEDLKNAFLGIVVKKFLNNEDSIRNLKISIDSINLNDYSFRKAKSDSKVNIAYCNSYRSKNCLYYEIDKNFDDDLSFANRERLINLASKEEQEKLKEQISTLEKDNLNLSNMILKDYIAKYGADTILKYKNLTDIVKMFLINGYIDNAYMRYISYFDEKALSINDGKFLQCLALHSSLNYDLPLLHIDNIISDMELEDFEIPFGLNIDLINHMLNKSAKYGKQIDGYFKQLARNNEESRDFIKLYLASDKMNDSFIKLLIKNCDNFWVYLVKNYNYPEEQLKNIYVWILTYADINDILVLNKENLLKNYSDALIEFTSLVKHIEISKITKLISELGLKFETIDFVNNNAEIENYIYENSHYKINYNNVCKILTLKYNYQSYEVETKNLTCILNNKNSNLSKYITCNFDEYFDSIYYSLGNSTSEDEDAIIYLLNNIDRETDVIEPVIRLQQSKINDISKIVNKKYWKFLFVDDKVSISWENLNAYFVTENADLTVLKQFIERNFNRLSSIDVNNTVYAKLIEKIINIKWMDPSILNALLFSSLQKISICTNSDNRTALIRGNLVEKNDTNTSFLVNEAGNDLIVYIKEYHEFQTYIENYTLPINAIDMILKSDVSNEIIEKIIFKSQQEILDGEVNTAYLCNALLKINKIDLNYYIIEDIFKDESISLENRIKLLNKYFDVCLEELEEIFENIGGHYANLYSEGTHIGSREHELTLRENLKSTGHFKFHKEKNDGSVLVKVKQIL